MRKGFLKVDPSKIVAVVETNRPDEVKSFSDVDESNRQDGDMLLYSSQARLNAEPFPRNFLPIQSGVGEHSQCCAGSLGSNKEIPPFKIKLNVTRIRYQPDERSYVTCASGCSLTIIPALLEDIYANFNFFKDKLILRPQENFEQPRGSSPVGINYHQHRAEAEIFGNVNSTHVLEKQI
jgi:acyl-CoA hydrolase